MMLAVICDDVYMHFCLAFYHGLSLGAIIIIQHVSRSTAIGKMPRQHKHLDLPTSLFKSAWQMCRVQST